MESIEILESKLDGLIKKIDKLEQTQELVSKQLMEFGSYLFNDERTGTDGIVKKIRTLEKDVEILKTDKKIRKASNAIWGSIGAVALLILKWLATKLLNI